MSRVEASLTSRMRSSAVALGERLSGWKPEPGSVRWLFIATMNNGGSTALARLLDSASAVTHLEYRGEGQWLVPELADYDTRWDAEKRIDYAKVRALWLRQVKRRGQFPCLVVEKSPPNMVRMRQLLETFSDMPTTLVRLTRDPYATIASWARRYDPEEQARVRGGVELGDDAEDTASYRVLGEVYGRRAQMLHALEDACDYCVSYEELTESTAAVLDRLRQLEPLLADVQSDARVKVKDYEPQELRNMNEHQIGKLSGDQIAAISAGLAPYAAAVNALGYELR